MQRLFKIIGGFLVVISALFFIAGQSVDFLFFKYQQTKIQKDIKKKIKKGVDEKDLITFEINPSLLKNITWKKPGKEFEYKWNLYDVVKREYHNGKFVFKCINDVQETELFAQLEQQTKNRLSENQANSDYYKNLVKDFLKNIYTTPQPLFLLGKKVCKEEKVEFFHSIQLDPISPPPQIFG